MSREGNNEKPREINIEKPRMSRNIGADGFKSIGRQGVRRLLEALYVHNCCIKMQNQTEKINFISWPKTRFESEIS